MSCSTSMKHPTFLFYDKVGRSKPKRKKTKCYMDGNDFSLVRLMRRKIMEGTSPSQAKADD